ncbi:GNAT family N-acetyltransferase [Puniceicoccaceae bacterium K14]|nr:GNAT family N-acetyltransferase [Puniceicoccaceae bacterium K14]
MLIDPELGPLFQIKPLERSELKTAIGWAAQEGWNPGVDDADSFWLADPEGFWGVEHRGELIATGSVVSYEDNYGFMGLFIVRPDFRGRGIGARLWSFRRDLLLSRLNRGASIGMDGVFEMQDWYSRGGFVFSHRNLRMEGVAESREVSPSIVPLTECLFEDVDAYDRYHFGVSRTSFLERWIKPRNGVSLGYLREGKLVGFGVLRKSESGYKIGPLFADEFEVARELYSGLCSGIAGKKVVLGVPDINENAVRLAELSGLTEVFGCARMYLGKAPLLPWKNIYSTTTFELG